MNFYAEFIRKTNFTKKMKKAILFSFALVLGSTLISCSNCYECTKDSSSGTDKVEICYSYGNESGKQSVEESENDGYFCTSK
jgi:predicted small secreted protein